MAVLREDAPNLEWRNGKYSTPSSLISAPEYYSARCGHGRLAGQGRSAGTAGMTSF
jgi:hypothetical protein